MFKAVDKNGVQVNLKDKVKFTVTQEDMFSSGTKEELEGIVISINSESMVQVQPKEGASYEVPSSCIEVTFSLINEVLAMKNTEDMKKIVLEAEARYKEAVISPKEKSGSKGGSKTKKESKPVTGTLQL